MPVNPKPEDSKPEESAPRLERIDDRLFLVGDDGRICVDFVDGPMGFRRRHGGGRGQAVAKAVGLKGSKTPPRVVDVTAGLGRDAFILATLGCPVLAMERHPDIHALCADGLIRALDDPDTADALADRLILHQGDALPYLQNLADSPIATFQPDVIYLDPMHPPRRKSALPRLEMRLFRDLVGEDLDQVELLQAALQSGIQRVVVKRPANREPMLPGVVSSIPGKTTRFDIYLASS